jgi:hypothetical protein
MRPQMRSAEDLSVERPSLRPQMRDDDPRVRAAQRAAEIRGHLGSIDDGIDEFAAPPAPEGWTYEWKRHSIVNQEDRTHMSSLRHKGWDPVPANRHPEMMPENSGSEPIMRKGMILMERPKEISDEIRNTNLRRARSQVQIKEKQLTSAPDGTFDRTHERVKPKINKSFQAMPIPEE